MLLCRQKNVRQEIKGRAEGQVTRVANNHSWVQMVAFISQGERKVLTTDWVRS